MAAERIKLAVDARMVEHSGIGTLLKNTLPRLCGEADLEVHLLGDREKLARFPWFDSRRFTALYSPIYGVKEQIELPGKIPRCDVFWSPHYNVPLAPIRARKRLGTVCDVFHLAYFDTLSLPQKLYAKVILKAAVGLADRLVTISEFSRGEILRRVGAREDKVEVIPCGCDRNFNRFEEQAIPEKDYLLFVGNVKPHKNIKGALAAFFRIAPRYPSLKFVIVGRREGFITGDGEVSNMVSGEFGARVVFTGHVPEAMLKTYYKRARALVFPSFYEGFGLPLLEAMSFGIPVVSSNRASLPEVGGDAVLYFDPSDSEALAERLEEVLSGRWRPDPERYRDRIRAFDWELGSRRYISLIRELAREKGR
jgi:glycosyltransferase involved in cell wall biosynthesis